MESLGKTVRAYKGFIINKSQFLLFSAWDYHQKGTFLALLFYWTWKVLDILNKIFTTPTGTEYLIKGCGELNCFPLKAFSQLGWCCCICSKRLLLSLNTLEWRGRVFIKTGQYWFLHPVSLCLLPSRVEVHSGHNPHPCRHVLDYVPK